MGRTVAQDFLTSAPEVIVDIAVLRFNRWC
jgi:hypothetical protein